MACKCRNCNAVFPAPAIAMERHGCDGPWYERVEICPLCRISGMLEVKDDAGLIY
ncbi:MAG: hypothetical protein IJO92_02755 [Clostridia bacterium]|nr:hypothetical protein [Clostridia bacterium]